MRFWDTSALVPLLVGQDTTESVHAMRSADAVVVVWWGTVVECASAIARLVRMGQLEEADADRARSGLGRLADTWIEVEPSAAVRSSAQRLLAKHDLTSGDALQLAAALCGPKREGHPLEFVCLDSRLRRGAEREGFTVLPSPTLEQGKSQ
jgi:predicted nucleic acid-binding protein